MHSGYPEVEEQEGTRIEKVLLAALVAFLLLGGFWTLDRMEGYFPRPVLATNIESNGYSAPDPTNTVSVESELGISPKRDRLNRVAEIANNRRATLAVVEAASRKAEADYEFRREEYRTAMQAGHPADAENKKFEAARTAKQQAEASIAPAKAESDRADKDLAREQSSFSAAQKRAQDVYDSRVQLRNVKLFALHFGFAGACLGLAWISWQAGRRRRWRYQTLVSAFLIAAILQLLGLMLRYGWELFVDTFAVLGISLMGTAVCILAIIGIKRWLFSPERLAQARLSSQKCPTCATHFEPGQNHCWHCGHSLVEPCPTCGEKRLLFAPHCGNCGSTTG